MIAEAGRIAANWWVRGFTVTADGMDSGYVGHDHNILDVRRLVLDSKPDYNRKPRSRKTIYTDSNIEYFQSLLAQVDEVDLDGFSARI
jgi:hypothetical protein